MSDTKVITGLVRFAYPSVFETKVQDGEDSEKYEVCILIPKRNKKCLADIDDAVDAALELGDSKLNNKDPRKIRGFKWPLKDGDVDRPDSPEFEGMMYLNARTKNKPTILDADKDEIIDKSDFYAGCWGRASINFYVFANKSTGIGCGLNNLQKLKDDDHLSGATSAKEDFKDDLSDEDLDAYEIM